MSEGFFFAKEYWSGDSRDGVIVNGDGYHFFKLQENGLIVEAYELYEMEDGQEMVTPLPEMHQVNWINDLGFEDFDALDKVEEREFRRVKSLTGKAYQG